MTARDVPIGIAGRVGNDCHQWLLDDRVGAGALGGVFFCEVIRERHSWSSYMDMYDAPNVAAQRLHPSISWLTAAESEPIVNMLPLRSVRLEHLASQERDREFFERETLQSVAVAYVRYQRTSDADPGKLRDWWAVECWYAEFMRRNEERYRDGLLALISAATTDEDLGAIGAGLLEDFIADDEATLVWIDEQAARSEAFRRALASVWIWDLPVHVLERVERAAGVPLARPGRT